MADQNICENQILDFKDMDAQSERSVSPNCNNVKFVVEANKGTFDNLNIKKGDQLILKGKKLVLKRFFE